MAWPAWLTRRRRGNPQAITADQLFAALRHLGKLQGFTVDDERLQWSWRQHAAVASVQARLHAVCKDLNLAWQLVMKQPDPARLPALAVHATLGCGVLVERRPSGQWLFMCSEGRGKVQAADVDAKQILWAAGVKAITQQSDATGHGGFAKAVRAVLWQRKGLLTETALASLFINLLNLGISFFSMQVYDRVIPTQGKDTLQVLGVGIIIALLVELGMKKARSTVMERMGASLDSVLSRQVFERLLGVRLDRFPAMVGTLASQVRGYEQVRAFFAASSLFTLVDLPFAAVFLAAMFMLAGPVICAVPLAAGAIALTLGLIAKARMDGLTKTQANIANKKTGLLVETVEGAETWKSSYGSWKFLQRWLYLSEAGIGNELRTRQVSETLNYVVGAMHQVSYAGVVAVGAYLAIDGQITMGAVIACSILSGRVLTPMTTLPGLLVQVSHAKAAMDGIERLYALPQEHGDIARPLTPSTLKGHYQIQELQFRYDESQIALKIPALELPPGQRMAVLGPIGSGKSTLIKLLTGMYAPTEGRILLDGLDLNQISKQVLARQIAYLAQDHRLFDGTLRENLLIGLADVPDDLLFDAMRRTGLQKFVSSHPLGLEMPIHEGGRGVSGGQKQLIAFTRLLLAAPSVYLLDEPTAAMDSAQEAQCLTALADELAQHPQRSLIVVTHKPSVLQWAERILLMADHQLVMMGPKQAILAKLGVQPDAAGKIDAVAGMPVVPQAAGVASGGGASPVKAQAAASHRAPVAATTASAASAASQGHEAMHIAITGVTQAPVANKASADAPRQAKAAVPVLTEPLAKPATSAEAAAKAAAKPALKTPAEPDKGSQVRGLAKQGTTRAAAVDDDAPMTIIGAQPADDEPNWDDIDPFGPVQREMPAKGKVAASGSAVAQANTPAAPTMTASKPTPAGGYRMGRVQPQPAAQPLTRQRPSKLAEKAVRDKAEATALD